MPQTPDAASLVRSDCDPRKIGYLLKDEDRPEIEAFLAQNPALVTDYIPVAIIGEGSALDLLTKENRNL
jgi:hypothetical protein